MAYETDERLKGYLDTNQMHREQLCLAVLALDKRFADVRPRHPRGGPDGGRDLEAQFHGKELAFGAVGFVNQAADIEEKKKAIYTKFSDDLHSADAANPKPSAFIFFTNVNFTVGEKANLVAQAKLKGFSFCEIFDRERLRIALDSPDGFAARFQYLNIAMSDAEQASFFAKWGDEIQSVITTGFQELHWSLSQLLFLQEAARPLLNFQVQFKLDREYEASEISHFRAFCSIYLREPKLGTLALLIGKTDRSERFRTDIEVKRSEPPGIAAGVASGQWTVPWNPPTLQAEALPPTERFENSTYADDDEETWNYIQTGCGSAIGMAKVRYLGVSYSSSSFIRFEPVLSLIDFDDCMIMPILNQSLAEKVEGIRIYANGYMLLDLARNDFKVDHSRFDLELDKKFSETELADPWVRLRPADFSSTFRLSFADSVPVRMFKSKRATLDSPK
ncbi:MAG: hypothetical protein J0H69_09795 [Burkholderiales bacterium]|nr:hypothetical protein [Burkholderiales bacterium]